MKKLTKIVIEVIGMKNSFKILNTETKNDKYETKKSKQAVQLKMVNRLANTLKIIELISKAENLLHPVKIWATLAIEDAIELDSTRIIRVSNLGKSKKLSIEILCCSYKKKLAARKIIEKTNKFKIRFLINDVSLLKQRSCFMQLNIFSNIVFI